MKNRLFTLALQIVLPAAVVALLILDAQSQPPDEASTQKSKSERSEIEHGRYLVHHVAMCAKCHTPKTEKGTLIEEKLLQGSPLPVESPYPHQRWALQAPKLAGLPSGWSKESLATFLQTGDTPTAFPVKPPMPPFRMNERDAKAVAAYLDSLGAN